MRRASRWGSAAAGVALAAALLTATGATWVPAASGTREPQVAAAGSTTHAALSGRFGRPLWVDPAALPSHVARSAGSTAGAAAARVIAGQPTARWVMDPADAVASAVAKVVGAAAAEHRVATLVAYAIPHRDCGGYSANSEESAAEYRRWVRAFVRGLGHRKAIIIVEPDALGLLSCLTPHQQRERLGLLRYATERFSAQGSWTYLDAGHSAWLPVGTAAARLRRAGIAAATGFSLNVAQFRPTGETTRYGTALAARVGGKHFVVDTSRNGVAPKNAQWCNPGGRGLGHRPTASTGTPLVDAYLWIKVPGESDGTCRKGPAAGRWFPAYAAMLVRNARL